MEDKHVEVLRFEIAKLEIQPGDVLVLRVSHGLSEDAFAAIRSLFEKRNVQILVIPKETDLSVVRAQGGDK